MLNQGQHCRPLASGNDQDQSQYLPGHGGFALQKKVTQRFYIALRSWFIAVLFVPFIHPRLTDATFEKLEGSSEDRLVSELFLCYLPS